MGGQSAIETDRISTEIDPGGDLSVGADAVGGGMALVKSAGRVLQILELFDEIQREARVCEIAEHLNFPQSSTSALLKSLTRLGYIDYDPAERTFLPTPRVTLLGSWLDKGPVRDGSLVRMLEHLSEATGDTVILAARNAIFSQYIRVLQARTAIRFHVPPARAALSCGRPRARPCWLPSRTPTSARSCGAPTRRSRRGGDRSGPRRCSPTSSACVETAIFSLAGS